MRPSAPALAVVRRGSGPPLVLLHGRGADHSTWEPLEELLPGYRLVLPDLLGHGDSPAPPEAASYSVEGQVEALAAALRDLGEPFALVGHSMGGWVAQGFALAHPGRLAALVLVATSPGSPYRGGRHASRRGLVEEQARTAESRGMQALVELLRARGEADEWLEARLLRMQPHAYAAIVRSTFSLPDFSDRLRHLTVPTLVVAGLDDVVFAPEAAELAERIPGAARAFFPGVGHSPHWDDAPGMARALAGFLAGRGYGPGR